MATFQKPTPLKAALKIGLYGAAGSGKTFSSLLIGEGLARHANKRIAFCDTEQGTAFYAQPVPQRAVHPEAFDFDVLYTKSITEVLAAVQGLDLSTYGVLVIDSITQMWDSCKNAFSGRLTRIGTIPLPAWAAIKKPYKQLLHLLLSLPVHVLICGRQGIDYGEDETTGELKSLGYRMRAEGETAYEPDVLLRLESFKASRKAVAIPVAHVEKDRTGILAGQTIEWPSFEKIAQPLLSLLGNTHTALSTDEAVSLQDAEALARQEAERSQRSASLAAEFTSRLGQTASVSELQRIGAELTPAIKQRLLPKDLDRVRRAYAMRLGTLKSVTAGTAKQDGKEAGSSVPPAAASVSP